MEDLLTVAEVSELLGLAQTTIRTAVSRGNLPARKKYNRILITPEDAEIYRQRTQPSGEKRLGRPRKAKPGTDPTS